MAFSTIANAVVAIITVCLLTSSISEKSVAITKCNTCSSPETCSSASKAATCTIVASSNNDDPAISYFCFLVLKQGVIEKKGCATHCQDTGLHEDGLTYNPGKIVTDGNDTIVGGDGIDIQCCRDEQDCNAGDTVSRHGPAKCITCAPNECSGDKLVSLPCARQATACFVLTKSGVDQRGCAHQCSSTSIPEKKIGDLAIIPAVIDATHLSVPVKGGPDIDIVCCTKEDDCNKDDEDVKDVENLQLKAPDNSRDSLPNGSPKKAPEPIASNDDTKTTTTPSSQVLQPAAKIDGVKTTTASFRQALKPSARNDGKITSTKDDEGSKSKPDKVLIKPKDDDSSKQETYMDNPETNIVDDDAEQPDDDQIIPVNIRQPKKCHQCLGKQCNKDGSKSTQCLAGSPVKSKKNMCFIVIKNSHVIQKGCATVCRETGISEADARPTFRPGDVTPRGGKSLTGGLGKSIQCCYKDDDCNARDSAPKTELMSPTKCLTCPPGDCSKEDIVSQPCSRLARACFIVTQAIEDYPQRGCAYDCASPDDIRNIVGSLTILPSEVDEDNLPVQVNMVIGIMISCCRTDDCNTDGVSLKEVESPMAPSLQRVAHVEAPAIAKPESGVSDLGRMTFIRVLVVVVVGVAMKKAIFGRV